MGPRSMKPESMGERGCSLHFAIHARYSSTVNSPRVTICMMQTLRASILALHTVSLTSAQSRRNGVSMGKTMLLGCVHEEIKDIEIMLNHAVCHDEACHRLGL